MAINFRCRCGEKITAPEERAGKEIRCLACGARVTIPRGRASAPAAGRAAPVSVSPAPGTPVEGARTAPPPTEARSVETVRTRPVAGGAATAERGAEAGAGGARAGGVEAVKEAPRGKAPTGVEAKSKAEVAAGAGAAAPALPETTWMLVEGEAMKEATTVTSPVQKGGARSRRRVKAVLSAVAALVVVAAVVVAVAWPRGGGKPEAMQPKPDEAALKAEVVKQVAAALAAKGSAESERSLAEKAGAAKGAAELWSAAEKMSAEASAALERKEYASVAKLWSDAASKYAAAREAVPLTLAQRFERLKAGVFTLSGHSGPVNSVDVSGDGKVAASAGRDGTVRLWDLAKQVQAATLTGHSGEVNAVAFSADGKMLATAGSDRTVRLWDAAKREQVAELKGHTDRVRCVAFNARGDWLASGGDDRTVRVWDTGTHAVVMRFDGNDSAVRGVAFSTDGKVLAGGGQGFLRCWDDQKRMVTDISARRMMGRGFVAVSSACFSSDGKWLATCGAGGGVALWDARTRQQRPTTLGGSDRGGPFRFPDPRRMTGSGSASFSPDSKVIAWSEGDSVQVWDVGGRKSLGVLSGYSARVDAVAFSGDGKRLVTGGSDGAVKVWGKE